MNTVMLLDAGPPPPLFGALPKVASRREDGTSSLVLGGPEEPPERWQYTIYAGPSDVRRAAAAELQQTPVVDELGQRRWDLPGGFQGFRTAAGYSLVTRDEVGWYLVAEAQQVVGRVPYHVLNELRRGAVWARRQGLG